MVLTWLIVTYPINNQFMLLYIIYDGDDLLMLDPHSKMKLPQPFYQKWNCSEQAFFKYGLCVSEINPCPSGKSIFV